MSLTTKKNSVFGWMSFCLNFSDRFGTVLKERNFRPKFVSKLCETFKTYFQPRFFPKNFARISLRKQIRPKTCEILRRISDNQYFYFYFYY